MKQQVTNLPSTFVYNDKYPFLSEDTFVPLEYPIVDSLINGKYMINKKGQVKNSITNKLLNPYINNGGYLSISTLSYNRKYYYYRVHRLVALTFLVNPNPEIYNVVNHIDCNRTNNNLSNLEWVTIKENNDYSKKSKITPKSEFVGYDENGYEVERFTRLNIPSKYTLKELNNAVNRKNNYYSGLFWKREYFEKNIPGYTGNLDDYEWFEHWKYPGLYVCKEGFIKIGNKLSWSVDTKSYHAYPTASFNKVSMRIHKVIMEYLLKRDILPGEVIDHINQNRYDNSFTNLRITDQKGNMNNVNTIRLLSDAIVVTDLYGDVLICDHTREAYNFVFNGNGRKKLINSSSMLVSFVSNKKYICYRYEDNESFLKKISRILYVLSSDGKTIISAHISIKNIRDQYNVKIRADEVKNEKYSFISSGRTYYIVSGIEAIKILKLNGHCNALSYKNDQINNNILKIHNLYKEREKRDINIRHGIVFALISPNKEYYISTTLNLNNFLNLWNNLDKKLPTKYGKLIARKRKSYGPDKFTIEILHEIDLDKSLILEKLEEVKNNYLETISKSFTILNEICIINMNENKKQKIISTNVVKKIIQLDIYGNFIKEWDSSTEASKVLSKTKKSNLSGNILQVCRKKVNTIGGFVWMFKEEYETIKDEDGNVDIQYLNLDKYLYGIVQLDLEGNFVKEYESIEDLKKSFSSVSHILSCCKGSRRKAFNYRWVYKIDYINNNVPSINFNKNRKSREIVQFDLEGNFIKEWDSIKSATVSLSLSKSSDEGIRLCCNGDKKSASGFLWCWKSDYIDNPNIRRKAIKNSNKPRLQKIVQLDLEGNFIKEWNNLTEIQNSLKIDRHCISKVCKNKSYIYRDYIWMYKKDYNPKQLINIDTKNGLNKNKKSVCQLDLEGNFIKEWDSITDVDKFYENMNNRPLKYILCNKKEGIFMGYRWIRKDDYLELQNNLKDT